MKFLPIKPFKPKTPFKRYYEKIIEFFKKKYPGKNETDQMKIIKQMFKNLEKKEKSKKYIIPYNLERKDFKKKMKNYKEKILELEKIIGKCPKIPIHPKQIFIKIYYQKIKFENSNFDQKKITKKLLELYKHEKNKTEVENLKYEYEIKLKFYMNEKKDYDKRFSNFFQKNKDIYIGNNQNSFSENYLLKKRTIKNDHFCFKKNKKLKNKINSIIDKKTQIQKSDNFLNFQITNSSKKKKILNRKINQKTNFEKIIKENLLKEKSNFIQEKEKFRKEKNIFISKFLKQKEKFIKEKEKFFKNSKNLKEKNIIKIENSINNENHFFLENEYNNTNIKKHIIENINNIKLEKDIKEIKKILEKKQIKMKIKKLIKIENLENLKKKIIEDIKNLKMEKDIEVLKTILNKSKISIFEESKFIEENLKVEFIEPNLKEEFIEKNFDEIEDEFSFNLKLELEKIN